jgi:polysaccharide biosynthesis protein PslG
MNHFARAKTLVFGVTFLVGMGCSAVTPASRNSSNLSAENPDSSIQNPGTGQPITGKPITGKPSTQNPSTQNPSTQNPSTQNPSTQNPALTGSYNPNPLGNWTNPGYNLEFVENQNAPVTPLNPKWTPVPAAFTAASDTGWPKTAFGMNIVVRGSYPNAGYPVGMARSFAASWPEVEPIQGKFDWTLADQNVDRAIKNGAKILLVLGYTPTWAARNPNETGCQGGPSANGRCSVPRDNTDWVKYVTAVVTRYKGKIFAYEPWNEPVSSNAWNGTPSEMATLQRLTYQTVKKIDPNALVTSVSGSDIQNQYGDYVAWFEQYLKAGASGYMDIMNWHVYTTVPENLDENLYGEFKDDSASSKVYRTQTVTQILRGMFARNGVGKLPFWITETNVFADQQPDQSFSPAGHVKRSSDAAAWIGRWVLCGAAAGVDAWFVHQWNDAADVSIQMGNPSVQSAWAQSTAWLVGAKFVRTARSPDGTRAVQVRRNGADAVIVWNPKRNVRVILPSEWRVNTVADLNGNVKNISGPTVGIGISPRLFYIRK